MKTSWMIVLAITLAACGGKKQEQVEKGSGSAQPAPPVDAAAAVKPPDPDPGSGSAAPTPDTAGDFITVFAEHKQKKADDPVQVHFKKFAVTKSKLDPDNLETSSATIEIDVTSLDSGKPQRDAHLRKPDYLNVPQFAKLTIDITDVKTKPPTKADRGPVGYTAKAKVSAVGVDKTFAVTFEVLEVKADSVRIKAEHTFKRSDFKIGKPVADKDESVADDLTIKMQLTLKKT